MSQRLHELNFVGINTGRLRQCRRLLEWPETIWRFWLDLSIFYTAAASLNLFDFFAKIPVCLCALTRAGVVLYSKALV